MIASGAIVADVVQTIANALPSIEEEVTVVIHGNSNSRRNRLLKMALAVAFGQVQARQIVLASEDTGDGTGNLVGGTIGAVAGGLFGGIVGSIAGGFLGSKLGGLFDDGASKSTSLAVPPPGSIYIEYDMMAKSVVVQLKYFYSGMLGKTVTGGAFSSLSDSLFSGPGDNMYGANWNNQWFTARNRDPLPDGDGRILAQGTPPWNDPDQASAYTNPAPYDGGTRGVYTSQLVFAAFAAPCTGPGSVNGLSRSSLAIDGPTEQISGVTSMTGTIKDIFSKMLGGGGTESTLVGGGAGIFDGGSGSSFGEQ